MKTFQNYHKHSMYTNVRISDSPVAPEDFAERAKQLGHGILSSCEHGWQGNYFEAVRLAKEYGLKPLIGAEAYWVKDRTEKDRTNCHIFLGAKNEQGRQALNDVLSEANLTGFYGQPRIDIPLILSLPKDDIIVTTACIAYWRYEDIENITAEFARHFGKSFFLEVQYHNTAPQIELNKRILRLHDELKIPLIMGCDSHYISEKQKQTRTDFLVSKGLTYPDEDGWFLDYPDGDTAYERFANQCVLSHEEINEAMDNTKVFLEVEEYDSPIFNTEIKMPSLYPALSQEEKNDKYKELVWSGWREYKKSVSEDKWALYESEIQKEIKTVEDTKMADYFIDNYHIIRKGKENGGWLTKSGRGCFTKDALVHTLDGLKTIDSVAPGDYVVDMNGDFQKVTDTMHYDVDEPLVKIDHKNGAYRNSKMICTLDHKILIFRNNTKQWIEASNIKKGDYVCCPKLHFNPDHNKKYTPKPTLSDKEYVFLPIENTRLLSKRKTTVYDLTVENTHSFLINNAVVHNSGVSYLTNMLLGFTEVDRIAAKIHMYPERFMSATRILQSGSLPDIDHNCASVDPFARAQQEILGENHAYPMISYGTMQKSAAWKLYAKSQGVPFGIANTVSDQIKKYETAVKHAPEDEKDDINVFDYIDKEFHEVYEKSKDYLGLVSSWSISPCSYLLFQGSIRKEIGLVKVKDNLCCLMDGHWAEVCHFLKNDLLKVSVVDLIYSAYRRIGMEPPTVTELLDMCPPDDKAWEIYEKGCTLGINQCEQTGTSSRVAKYKPKNISELGAFVAAIRPGFKSMYKTFEDRKPFAYGVKAFDDLIQTDEMPNSFLLYQEQEMAALNYAGIDMSDCYTAIKNIAKKRVDKVLAYKGQFINGFSKVMIEDEHKTQEDAANMSQELWQIIEDSSSYSFNACLSGDTKIQRCSTGKQEYHPTVEEMFKIKNNLQYAKETNHLHLREKYQKTFGYGLSLFDDARIHANNIIDIREAGVREIYRLTTDDGKYVDCTSNHKFPTPNGLKHLSDLKNGDELYAIGSYEVNHQKYPFTNGTYETNVPIKGEKGFQKKPNGASVTYKNFQANSRLNQYKCRDCNREYDETTRFEVHHVDFDRTNNNDNNFVWLCASCHKKRHYSAGRVKRYEKGIPTFITKIVNIRYIKTDMTYDVEMSHPAHNLVVNNGLVVSNSHSYCVALDSLYSAWLKAHHPLEFYEVLLTISEQKGDKDKMNALKEEAESYFNIKFPPFRFGQDNRTIKADTEHNVIVNSISAIKGFSPSVGAALFDCSQNNFTSFIDVLAWLDRNSVKASKVLPLITIDYFQQFGNINELLAMLDLWELFKQGEAKSIKKDKITSPIVSNILASRCSAKNKDGSDSAAYKVENEQTAMLCLYDFEQYIKQNPMNPPSMKQQIQYDMDILGYADVVTNREEDRRRLLITDVVPLSVSSGGIWAYRLGTQSLGSGKTARLTVKASIYDKKPIKSGDIIYAADLYKNQTGYWYLLAYNKED